MWRAGSSRGCNAGFACAPWCAAEDLQPLMNVPYGTHPRQVLDSSVRMAINEIRHRARLEKDYGEVPAVRGAPGRLTQVFLNLLVNAAHAIETVVSGSGRRCGLGIVACFTCPNGFRTVDHIPFGAYPTALVRDLGGWNENQLVNEDFEFDYRVRRSGGELLFDPAIRIDWDCRQSVPALFRQYRRYGAGKVQTLVRHPESVGLRHLAAPVVVGALAGSLPLLAARRTRPLGAAALAGYGALVAVASMRTGTDLAPRDRRWVPAAFVALHLGWGVGFWEEIVSTAVGRGGPRRSLEAS